MSAKLSLYGVPVNREALRAIPTPKATDSFTPVPHHVLVHHLLRSLRNHGLGVRREEYAVNRGMGHTLFGVMDLDGADHPDYMPSFGFRASYNRHMALRAFAGLRVFFCDNLAFSGEHIVLRRKHSAPLDIEAELDGAVRLFLEKERALDRDVANWKEAKLPYQRGKQYLFDMFAKHIVPLRLLPEVASEWEISSFREFDDNGYTYWRYLIAVTTAARGLPIGQRNKTLVNLGTYFRDLTGGQTA
jgi:hypothetical protein